MTFCVVVPPKTSMQAFGLDALAAKSSVFFLGWNELERPVPFRAPVAVLGFPILPAAVREARRRPLRTEKRRRTAEPAWLCTQGVGGPITHFFRESYYAIDLQCERGTSLAAPGDGVITEVCRTARCCGSDAENLSSWTSVAMRLDEPPGLVVEYLHISTTVPVGVGDRVSRGQVIAFSSDCGFAPEPHVHVEAHFEHDSACVLVAFEGTLGPFVPEAGCWYNAGGKCDGPGNSVEVDVVDVFNL
jgi:murein DD-endopeptidase MepM/ murein hydrolase activator NlpD